MKGSGAGRAGVAQKLMEEGAVQQAAVAAAVAQAADRPTLAGAQDRLMLRGAEAANAPLHAAATAIAIATAKGLRAIDVDAIGDDDAVVDAVADADADADAVADADADADAGAAAADAAADRAWHHLHQAACAPYRAAGRFAWHFARGKLGRDPVFRALLERGDLPAGARVLDIGCGQGLMASLLAAAAALAARGAWPASWGAAPAGACYTGIELMARDVVRAEAAVGHLPGRPRFACADMCSAALPASDVAVILDVLHYVDVAAQDAVLARVRDAPPPRGRLLLRIGDASDTRRFAMSQWVDRIVTLVRGHRVAPTFGRPLGAWVASLQRLGFRVRSLPMSRGTPFANVLLVADLADEADGAR